MAKQNGAARRAMDTHTPLYKNALTHLTEEEPALTAYTAMIRVDGATH